MKSRIAHNAGESQHGTTESRSRRPVSGQHEAHYDSLVPPLQLNRRAFLATSLAAGFAAAAGPVVAQTAITTDTEALTAGMVRIPVEGGSIPAYRAMPEGEETAPVVLVVQEIFGVHEYIQDVCRRLAKAGYMAVAPELYVRQGDPRRYTEVSRLISEVVDKVPDEQVMADLDATVAWAGKNGGNANRLGITGFCWGGRITWLFSAHNPQVRAGVAWYGRLVGDATEKTPRHPVDVAARLTTPVLGLYGAKDGSIPLDTVKKMEEVLAQGKSQSKFVIFENSGHAFHADYRPTFNEADAKKGWQLCLDWFLQHGVA